MQIWIFPGAEGVTAFSVSDKCPGEAEALVHRACFRQQGDLRLEQGVTVRRHGSERQSGSQNDKTQ